MADKQSGQKRQLIEKAKSSQVVVIIVASVIVSASIIGIKILWEQRGYQSEIITAKEAAANQLEANIAAVDQLEQEFVKLENSDVNSALVLDALPSKYDFPALATSIEKLAALSRVEMSSFSGEDQTGTAINSSGSPVPVEIPFTVSVSGSYENVQLFMQNLQKSIRPFAIDEMSIEASETGIQMSISAKTYYQPAKNLEIRKKTITTDGSQSAATQPSGTAGAPGQTPTGIAPGADSSAPASGAAQ
jgi:Tfp pilus assembly protein PilO